MHSSESKRGGGYTILGAIGQCGPLLGTNVFPESEAPRYAKGLWISAAMCLMVAVVAGVLSLWIVYENRQMEKEGVADEQGLEETSLGQPRRQKLVW